MLAALWCFLQVLGAYVVIDAATGVYHWLTDRGYNFRQQVEVFKLHHEMNGMDGWGWDAAVAGLPTMCVGLWFESSFLIAAGSFGVLSQIVVSNRGDTRLKESNKKQLS